MTQINQIERSKKQEMNAALLMKSNVEIKFENSVSSSVNPGFLWSLSAKYESKTSIMILQSLATEPT